MVAKRLKSALTRSARALLATEGTQEIKQNLVKSNADSTDMTQEER